MFQYVNQYAFRLAGRLRRDEGQTLVEYALIIALVSVALIVALNLLAVDIGEIFSRIGSTLDAA